jgi:hypothetical protein
MLYAMSALPPSVLFLTGFGACALGLMRGMPCCGHDMPCYHHGRALPATGPWMLLRFYAF